MSKSTIKDLLNAQEKKVLENLYKSFRVPTDQLRRCPDILHAIAAGFDRLTSRRIEPGLLLRYMYNRRKEADWPKLGKRAQKFESLLNLLSPSHVVALEKVYEKLGRPVDAYQFNATLMRQLSQEFFAAADVEEDGQVLAGVMIARRKRELWPCLFEERDEKTERKTGGSFTDIQEVHRKYKTGS